MNLAELEKTPFSALQVTNVLVTSLFANGFLFSIKFLCLNEKTLRFVLYFCKGNQGLTQWPTNETNPSVASLVFHFCEIKNIMRSFQCLIWADQF